MLATAGYVVLCVNPRGSSTYGVDFVKAVLEDWGGEDYLDIMASLDQACSLAYVDSSRLGVHGYSYGGYMTSWIIGHDTRFGAAVVGASCIDLPSRYGTSDIGVSFGEVQWGGSPMGEVEAFRERSPLTRIHRRTALGTALEEASGCSSESGIMVLEQKPARKQGAPNLPQNKPDRIRILFDDHRLVANAGLLLPATLARHLGLRELVDHHLDLGGAPGRANTGDKMLTLVASALAGGDCIDDADALRAGGTVGVLGCVVKAPSTLGTFLRSFRWGHVRQLDRVSRQLLARAWAAGAGPGDSPLTIDLDSTICETYGLAKEGARHHGYTGARGYHPLLAIAAGTGEVLMSRLREGRANTARGAAHFLRETVGRVRYGGARGQLTVRADSGFYAHTVVAACREMDVRFSITIRQRASLRDLIEAIPEEDWTPIPYWMDGAADVAETTYTPFQTKPDAPPVRLIVRRVKPTPGSQLALFARYSYHAFITDRDGETLELEADHRRHAEVENAIRDLKYGVGLNHMPSGRFAANGAWLAVQVMAHNLARWTARIGLGEGTVITKTLRRRVFALVGRITRSARRLTLHLPRRWPWETQFSRALARLQAIPFPA